MQRYRKVVVIRHCTMMENGEQMEVWPGKTFFQFDKNPENRKEYLVGEESDRPTGTISGDAVVMEGMDKGDIFVVEGASESGKIILRALLLHGKHAEPLSCFPKEIYRAKDPIETAKEYAFQCFSGQPVGKVYLPIPSNNEREEARKNKNN